LGLSEVSLAGPQVQTDSHQLWRARIRDWYVISVDVETAPQEDNRIFKLGAVRSDGDRSLTLSTTKLAAADVVRRVDELSAGCKLLLGHNLRRHDLVELRRQYPNLRCTSLPVLDTLELSALAFPNNPYHRLVKGYKLVSDSRNEPERDARIALELLVDELVALNAMKQGDPEWVSLLHFLVRGDAPLDELFKAVRGAGSPANQDATRSALSIFRGKCCLTGLRRAAETFSKSSPETQEDLKTLAYALGWIRVSGGNSVIPLWVMESMPAVRQHVARLREEDCGDPACGYCVEQHNPENLLQSYFQKPNFRDKPASPNGTSLQRAIVQAGLKRESLLAVLPTGGGKSICYQLLNANQN
jgi:ATP-dependent DNA helicase RecQ